MMAYSLLKAIERRKLDLKAKGSASLTEVEGKQLEFPRMRGATFLLAAAIAKCMETILGRAVPNAFRLSFGGHVSPRKAKDLWRPIVEATIPFCERLRPAVNSGLNNSEEARRVIEEFRDLVEATKVSNSEIFRAFADSVTVDA
ncbi:MAG: hypothetical protein FJW34_09405 [Acidobacteria bacterium]|nr:hypothetical protein [Acidobacteriota bacterium]